MHGWAGTYSELCDDLDGALFVLHENDELPEAYRPHVLDNPGGNYTGIGSFTWRLTSAASSMTMRRDGVFRHVESRHEEAFPVDGIRSSRL